MNPDDLERVFGRGRLRMVTGAHVEVFREEAAPGERRRYTKRFLATPDGDFRLWTEREWRILARLVGHGIVHVPDVVQFDRGAPGRPALVQTYDAGVTVDHWATLLPVARDGVLHAHLFEDAAHWWALARHALAALDAIHALDVVHLDLKADNVCIPYAPADADPRVDERVVVAPRFEALALIDFAFSLVSGEPLEQALPIARQPDYAYQSPRLLHALEAGAQGDLGPTRALDWRCDLYSLAAMLRRCLPDPDYGPGTGWTPARLAQARALVRELLAAHDAAPARERPHRHWIESIDARLAEPGLAGSLARGWTLASPPEWAHDLSPTPITRIALPLRDARSPVQTAIAMPTPLATPRPAWSVEGDARPVRTTGAPARPTRAWAAVAGIALAGAVAAPLAYRAWSSLERPPGAGRDAGATHVAAAGQPPSETAQRPPASSTSRAGPAPPPVAGASSPMAVPDTRAAAPAATQAPTSSVPDAAAVAAGAPPAPGAPPGASPRATSSRAPAATARLAHAAAAERTTRAPAPGDAIRLARASAERAPASAAHASARAPVHGAARPELRLAHASTPAGGNAGAAHGSTTRGPLGRGSPATAPANPSLRVAAASAPARAAPKPDDSPLRPALPPRIVAMLAATQLPPASSSGEKKTPGAVPAAPTTSVAAAPNPSPFPANAPVTAQRASYVPPVDYGARAQEMLATQVPRIAQHAERLAARALFLADHADEPARIADVLYAADAVRLSPQDPLVGFPVAREQARALEDAGRSAGPQRWGEAVEYGMRAFGANPLDASIAGQLAALQLHARTPNSWAARSLALHALAVHDGAHPGGRVEDWMTLATANALAGREHDARAAWIVALAVSRNPARACRAAMDAYMAWGEALRGSVEALSQRAQQWSGGARTPECEFPLRRLASAEGR